MGNTVKHFGDYLRTMRVGINVTPLDIARATNLTEKDVIMIEAGQRPIPPLVIVPWADTIRVNPHLLVTIMINCNIRKVCLQARLPYLFKVVPIEEITAENSDPYTATFAYQQRGLGETGTNESIF